MSDILHDDYDPAVDEALRPLSGAPTPDVWSLLDHRGQDVVDLGPPRRRPTGQRWVRPLLAAAAVLALVAAGAALLPRQDQRIESPTDQQPDADGAEDGAEDGGQGAVRVAPPDFPDGVEIGPDRATMSSLAPTGSFVLTYGDAGVVLADVNGEVLGHYRAPEFPASTSTVLPPETGDGVPSACRGTTIGQTLFCVTENGPTVETLGTDGGRRLLAAWPDRPASAEANGRFPAEFVDGYSQHDNRWGPRPMLLQLLQDVADPSDGCDESSIAVLAEDTIWTTNQPHGGTIRHIDGSNYWTGSASTSHQSQPIGWNADGEMLVWQYNSACPTEVDIDDGVYAFTIEGDSRLLFATHPDVTDVSLLDYSRFDDVPLDEDAADITDEYPDLWQRWAGPLLWDEKMDPETLLTDPRYQFDLELAMTLGGMGSGERWVTITDTEPRSWIFVEGDLAVRFSPTIWFGENEPDGNEFRDWSIAAADTFLPADDDYLGAQVRQDPDGLWVARFDIPGLNSEITAVYESGDTNYQPSVTESEDNVRLEFSLNAEPTEPSMLRIRWARFGQTVAIKHIAIPPGEFAAG